MKITVYFFSFLVLWGTGLAADWRQEADERIERHRTSLISLVLKDPYGKAPPAGTMVTLRMTRSAFHWGTAVNERRFAEAGEVYQQRIPELFNTIVLENGHKWSRWLLPERREASEAVVAFAREHGLAIRGHALVWGVVKYSVIPEPYREAIRENKPGLEEELLEAIDAHIREIASAMPFIYSWDLLNEPINEPHLFNYLGAKTVEQRAALVTRWAKVAREAAPQAALILNEFHIMAGPAPQKDKAYFDLLKASLRQGAPIDGVGFQNHYWGGALRRDPESIYEQMNRYADLGLTLSVTEFDTTGGGWAAQGDREGHLRAQAEWLETLLTVIYSHPASREFLMWGFTDAIHWRNSAPLFQADGQPKPALDVWRRLVLGEWKTNINLPLNATGRVNARAHHGDYVLEVYLEGERHQKEVTIGPETRELAWNLGWDN